MLERTLAERGVIYLAIMNRDSEPDRLWVTVHISGIEPWLRTALTGP